jgi:effector-binding domain-containing protein
MRILKKIAMVLVVLFIVYLVIALFLPSSVKIERSTMINAPAAVVHEQISTLTNWHNWSYWDNIDPNMKSTFSGPASGVGAKHEWSSDNDQVGHGSLTIVTDKPDSVITELAFEGMGTSLGGWTIRDTTGGVIVTTYMEIKLGLLGRIFPGMMMDKWLGPDFEKSLAGLKKQAELLPKETTSAKPEIKVEATTVPAMIYASYRMQTSNEKISSDIGASYGKIGAFMNKNGLQQSGAVFTIYHSYSPAKIDMECGIPVDKMIKGEGEIKVSEMKAGNAVVAHYYGDYAGTGAAHELIDKWMKENNKKATGAPWEVYVTDPGVEKDTMKWLTEVYYPIE